MVDLTTIVGNLERMGFYEFVLPWLLFFAVVLGVLGKTQVISTENRINSIIAAVVAFFIVAFVPLGGITAYYTNLFGVAGMIIGTLLVLVLLSGVLGFKPSELISNTADNKPIKWAKPFILVILVIFAYIVYTSAVGGGLGGIGLTISDDTLTLLFVGAFILFVIWLSSSGGKTQTGTSQQDTD